MCVIDHSAVLQPLLHLFYSEPGNGLWKRKADTAFQHCTVCLQGSASKNKFFFLFFFSVLSPLLEFSHSFENLVDNKVIF